MASSSTNQYPNYPYPSEFNVSDLVPDKLSKSNYSEWKLLMLDFIESRGMNEFITDIEDPDQKKKKSIFDDDRERSWRKSDGLVRTWILSTLNKDIVKQVLHHKTAREVWMKLETLFGSRKAEQPAHTSSIGTEQQQTAHTSSIGTEQQQTEAEKRAEEKLEAEKRAEEKLHRYMPLQIAAIQGDVQSACDFLRRHPGAILEPISTEGETVLITAVRSVRRNELVRCLLLFRHESEIPGGFLRQSDNLGSRTALLCLLCQSDDLGRTALHEAAEVGNVEAATILVAYNGGHDHDDLLSIEDKKKQTPLIYAAKTGNREMVCFLLDQARARARAKARARARAEGRAEAEAEIRAEAETLLFSETGRVPPTLLYHLANSGLYDIALNLLQRNNKLVDPDTSMSTGTETSPLMAMSQKRSSFRSGTPLNSFQKFIYSMPDIKHVREIKLKHDEALELVKCLCKEIAKLDYSTAAWMFAPALAQATSSGIHEIVEEILRSYPAAIYFKNENDQSIFQSAIVWRRENVFNLIYQLKECSHKFLSVPDKFGNNALHLAGCLGPQQHLSVRVSAAGAALQMQRELQWFKEVEKFVLPQDKECRNDEGMTPAEVFTKTHKELVEAGERWMKDTATSCTIVAALIATVMFAAAITVPGGNNASSGVSIFSKRKAFVIFGLSDALALFASIASLLMFLSILTARYAEEDFLFTLPKRLICGLVYLFLSISSTMTAFGATVYLMMGENRPWIIYPIVAFAYIPVQLFVSLLFPLLIVMHKSTHRPAIFGKQSDHMLF